jgi:hypothetical protein
MRPPTLPKVQVWAARYSGYSGARGTTMIVFKRPGDRTRFRFMPGCLIWSLLLSITLTILINLAIRAF